MSDEYPQIRYRQDWEDMGYDGVIEKDMVLCVESFTGSEHGGEGVKLEQMVLVSEMGCQLLSMCPFEKSHSWATARSRTFVRLVLTWPGVP